MPFNQTINYPRLILMDDDTLQPINKEQIREENNAIQAMIKARDDYLNNPNLSTTLTYLACQKACLK